VFDFTQPAVEAARALLGATVRVGEVAVRLTETEAYAGVGDPASHSTRGRRPSTEALFGPAGTLYCYLSYGVHICGNLTCGPDQDGSAVLLRAGEVVEGVELARQRRMNARLGLDSRGDPVQELRRQAVAGVDGKPLSNAPAARAGLQAEAVRDAGANSIPDVRLARGPGCLGQVLGLTLGQSGWLAGRDFSVTPCDTPPEAACGPRVGVSLANARPWRFWIVGAPSVSAYSRSPRAVPNSW
jgi:DNA-3-methyladenine glycosylase